MLDDYEDSISAVRTTANTLRAAGVDPMKITVSLIAVAMHLYRDEFSNEELTEDDLRMLFSTVTQLAAGK